MNADELISQIDRIMNEAAKSNPSKIGPVESVWCEAVQLLSDYGGANNAFLRGLETNNPENTNHEVTKLTTIHILQRFRVYIENNLLGGTSVERQIKITVVNEYLEQAHYLLLDKSIHPSAPTILIGASLEEYLRNWVEEKGLIGGKKGMENYAQLLQDAALINKQDRKDITAWAGLRNSAAHGDWDEVEDRNKIETMLLGVNNFIRSKTSRK